MSMKWIYWLSEREVTEQVQEVLVENFGKSYILTKGALAEEILFTENKCKYKSKVEREVEIEDNNNNAIVIIDEYLSMYTVEERIAEVFKEVKKYKVTEEIVEIKGEEFEEVKLIAI